MEVALCQMGHIHDSLSLINHTPCPINVGWNRHTLYVLCKQYGLLYTYIVSFPRNSRFGRLKATHAEHENSEGSDPPPMHSIHCIALYPKLPPELAGKVTGDVVAPANCGVILPPRRRQRGKTGQ